MKKLIPIIGLVLFGVAAVVYYLYNKPHSNMNKAAVFEKISAQELFAAFDADEDTANKKYLDQVVAVTGAVREVKTSEEGKVTVTLDVDSDLAGVVCELDEFTKHAKTDFQTGETVTIKGICTGMLMDVVLVRCVVIS